MFQKLLIVLAIIGFLLVGLGASKALFDSGLPCWVMGKNFGMCLLYRSLQ